MIKLNSDLGEGFGPYKMGNDKEIMRYIDMANIACGFHAGDPMTINNTIKEAKKNSVTIGAHPGYQDILGFGRRSIPYKKDELKTSLIYQVGALKAIANSNGVDIKYIKPHGALYNDMMANQTIYKTILEALSSYDKNLKLMILSTTKNSEYKALADDFGIELIYEAFADRAYQDNGYLVSRKEKDSLLHNVKDIIKRVKTIIKEGYIDSINGKKLYLKIDSLCVHGDNKEAINITKSIREEIGYRS